MNRLKLKIENDGRISSLLVNEIEFLVSECESGIFLLQFRDSIGNPYQIASNQFEECTVSQQEDGYRLEFSQWQHAPKMRITIRATLAGDSIHWNLSVQDCPGFLELEWMDFPRLRLNVTDETQLLLPYAEGMLVDGKTIQQQGKCSRNEYADYPMTGISSFYPGPAALQFEAVFNGETGLVIVCQDPQHFPKSLDVRPDSQEAIRLVLQHFTGGAMTLSYDVVMTGITGDWQDAAEIYRVWMEASDPCVKRKITEHAPAWLLDSPVIAAYPIKGRGLDTNATDLNENYPYANMLPVMRKYQDVWNSPVMALLMHWEGTAPWAPPYVWPPVGGEQQLAEFADSLHADGNYLGLYCSGIAWTQQSMIDKSYSLAKKFEDEHLATEMCLGPRGEMYSRVCNGPWAQRIGYDLCASRDFTRRTVTTEIESAARTGVDYMQYFDQNQGGASPLCYSRNHNHPHLPGSWQTAAMRELFRQANEAGGKTIIGCENGAAAPYAEDCLLNDLRGHLAWESGVPVPLYSYILHEYTRGFSGNCVCLKWIVDLEKTDSFLLWHLAWHFVAGNLLTVVLKDGGQIHWNWAIPWTDPAPEQAPLNALIRNCCDRRRGTINRFMTEGKMCKSPECHSDTMTVFPQNAKSVDVPTVLHTTWQCGDRKLLVAMNTRQTEQHFQVSFGSPADGTLTIAGKASAFSQTKLDVNVPPLEIVVVEF